MTDNTKSDQPAKPVASKKELKVLRECLTEAIWYRSLPLSCLSGVTVLYLVKKGILKPSQRFGPWGKMAGAAFVGYWVGKVSYIISDNCKDKFLTEAPNDEIAYHIRKKRGMMQPWKAEEKFGHGQNHERLDVDMSTKSKEQTFLAYVSGLELTERELSVLEECNDCAFYYYSLPTCIFMGIAVLYLQRRGILSKSKFIQGRLAPVPKILLAVSLGYLISQYIYWGSSDCAERFLVENANGRIADFVRNGRETANPTNAKASKAEMQNKSDVLIIDPFAQETYVTKSTFGENFWQTRPTTRQDLIDRIKWREKLR